MKLTHRQQAEKKKKIDVFKQEQRVHLLSMENKKRQEKDDQKWQREALKLQKSWQRLDMTEEMMQADDL